MIAEKCFVRLEDYPGLRFVEKLKHLEKLKARAEVAVYQSRFDEAENIYREIDRYDLIVQLRVRIGDFSRVLQLLRSRSGSDDELRVSLNRLAIDCYDSLQWEKAIQYLMESGTSDKLLDCLYKMQSFEGLSSHVGRVNDESHVLSTLAGWFDSVGMYQEAIDCFLQCKNIKAALDSCIRLNKWKHAIELGEKHNFSQVEGLFRKMVSALVNQGPLQQLQAAELYRSALRPHEAAVLIGSSNIFIEFLKLLK